ncbi:DUF7521 family protein [Halapricum hydrolyticum]|uniref:Uncharacterized protein n=1 Tax=Halapricum hydrolyticum TaxID=2979991 RepID=A0AAE3IDX2_9EURY|nr:hypothetical protein [Halapricum hydrolyticum]MCU4719501.1 hypothetical protein [Halapricum hydrolyticum]MCU4728467.1 hypothetical protein [Halapricum hydrolyticum]
MERQNDNRRLVPDADRCTSAAATSGGDHDRYQLPCVSTRARYLRDATVGFGFITVGVLVEGFLYQLTDLTLTQVHVVESVVLVCALGVLLRSFPSDTISPV